MKARTYRNYTLEPRAEGWAIWPLNEGSPLPTLSPNLADAKRRVDQDRATLTEPNTY